MLIIDKILNRVNAYHIDVVCKDRIEANLILRMIGTRRYVSSYTHTEDMCCDGIILHIDVIVWGNGRREQIFQKISEIYSCFEH